MKKKLLSSFVLLIAVVTGAVAQTTYKVSVKDGTEDAAKWTIAPTEATTSGVAAGTQVTATYSGAKKVKSVKAAKKGDAPASADMTVTYALSTGDNFTSGQTVEVKNAAEDVVATITYGESGGNNFKAAKTDSHVSGYTAYTEGNGTNGEKAGGTFYTITPKVDAKITVAVVLNADKSFYIEEDGVALADYNGITVGNKYYGTYEFEATAGKAYKVYCAGSKLGFYGFEMAISSIDLTTTDSKIWTLAEMPGFDVELEVEYETELALSETTDNSAALTEWDGCEADVTLTRTLAAGSWNTLALPYDVSALYLYSLKSYYGASVKELTGATFSNGTLTLTFADASSIVAGKPYLVKVTTPLNFSTQAMAGVIVSKTAKPFTSDNVDFIPTLGATTIEGSDTKAVLFLTANNTLLNPSALPANMKGFRAYFQLKGDAASARMFAIDFGDGETTGIKAIDNGQLTIDNDRYYDLQGRKVNAAQKGVYIQNGKKVIIK